MQMGLSSIWRSVVLLCLPTVVAVILGVYYIITDFPEMVRDENARYLEDVERFSKSIEESENEIFVWKRGAGIVKGDKIWEKDFPPDTTWKSWNPVDGTKRKEMWGYRETAHGRLVWRRSSGDDDTLVYGAIANVDKSHRSWMILGIGAVFFVLLVVVTFIGVKYFIDYVKMRDDFMAATAHDLTTPLVAMRYMIGRNDAEALTLCERMLRLVANIKDFMRQGGVRSKPKLEKVDIIKGYEEAYSLFREDYRDIFNGEDIVVSRGEGVSIDGPIYVMGDETMLVQILWNLLGNDLKYAAPFGRVEVKISAIGKFIEIAFIDEGQGMSLKDMRRAFNRYYRAKTVLVSGKGGFGIGLSTSREFAEKMGGKLLVSANKPHGCIFTLKLKIPISTITG